MKRQPSLTRRDVKIILEDVNLAIGCINTGFGGDAKEALMRIAQTAVKIRNRVERDKRK